MKEIIDKLRKAKRAHKRWVGHALAMIEGIPVDKDQVPINYTDCVFGNWYYDEGQDLSGIDEFAAIEEPHTELHVIYMEIFNILFAQKKKSFFSKLIGKSTQLSEADKQLARAKYRTLEEVSKRIIDKLDALEKRLKLMGEEKISELV